jgi:pyruvate, orthophosphate dikinase
MAPMYAHDFDAGTAAGKDLLGGKGDGLATMTRLGLPVPPGFTLTTEACLRYLSAGTLPDDMWRETLDAVHRLEEETGRTLGATEGTPLLVSVRSGSKFSMPGMMDTVLNLGMNDAVVEALASWSGNEHFAWDAYRRFVQTYGKVVLRVEESEFQDVLTELREARGVADDSQLAPEDLETATRRFQQAVVDTGLAIPDDPVEQLRTSIAAVFASWNNRRAVEYRRLHGLADDLGTACNVQMMVFGDLGDDSGTGVCFTRDPATGEAVPYGDYLPNAQGEDVVAGIRRTLGLDALRERHPDQHRELVEVMGTLERHYRDMCDIEFTIERERLWILQTRVGKRTAAAAVRMAVEMAHEGLIDRDAALLRVEPTSLEQMLHPRLDTPIVAEPLASGLNASPGAASGQAVFDADRAVEVAGEGRPVILVRWETTPDDIHGMAVAEGILTSHGGRTSHAAVVARGMGTPAVTGVSGIVVDEGARRFTAGSTVVEEGDVITLDGGAGTVYLGELPLTRPEPTPEMEELLGWADGVKTLGVRANADDERGATEALRWGAEGIGLARTEHMFMGERLPIVRNVILGKDVEESLAALHDAQIDDFERLLTAMDGLPVVVRLLDPPLHEFLPSQIDLLGERSRLEAASEETTVVDEMLTAVQRLQETNPMMGLRGVRLGIVHPGLYRIQVQAAVEAVRRRRAAGGDPHLELMVPLVSTPAELAPIVEMIAAECESAGVGDIPVGTMIEIPRAALRASELAGMARFFSFGTNDLTQMTFGISRDDAQDAFLTKYLEDGVLRSDPFVTLDVAGVGRLVELAAAEGRAANPDLEVGICGEHGGDPATIAFCHRIGMDYVSCSPLRVPIARLAAAHAALGAVAEATTV